ncbi:hypothetical protein [Maribacter sp. ACAM166]|uniref:hypothetical protein n=1 Tax=Maribacter sp. ACAM166 TaxID=2508996 RepID=UPI00148577B5|nr:hypothetical protein [Maribacter sp. ACAM166]
MRDEFTALHLQHLKGVPNADFFQYKAEIIPKEPGRVMLPREAIVAIRLQLLC